MDREFQEFDTTPTLTLEPFKEEKRETEVKEKDAVMDDSILSEEEKRTVNAFAEQIDLTNSAMILQYGAGTQ